MDQQLRSVQKLATLGTATAMLAHEVRNLLTPAVSFAKYALESGEVDLMRQALETTVTNGSAAALLSERVMGLAADAPGAASANVREAIDGALALMTHDLHRDQIHVNVSADTSLSARMSPSDLRQLLFNLFLNARQAMRGVPGVLSVQVDATDADVRIAVCDTGCGIAAEDLPHVFEPFYSSRHDGGDSEEPEGVGLGLTICARIVRSAGGRIHIDSAPGKGTRVSVELPRSR